MKTNEQSKNEKPLFSFSYFPSLWSTESTIITLQQLFQQTTDSLWKPSTECYRKLNGQPGRENEAKMTKTGMPVVIAEGICRPRKSHAATNLEKLNGQAMYDLDHSNERTAAIKDLFRHLPYVTYSQTSISGNGLKVFVFLDVYTPDEYPIAYAICQQTLENLTLHPCDPQCARITQPCSCVWDPDAYFNPNPQPFPWREQLAANPSLAQLPEILRLKAKGITDAPQFTYVPGIGNPGVSPIPPATEACGYIETFIRTFAHYHPWQKGNRHESMLALGRSARRKGFSKDELKRLTVAMAADIVGNSYTMKELQKDLFTGYQYVDLSYHPQNAPESLPLLPTATFTPPPATDAEEQEEDSFIKDEELRASSPLIPDEVYKLLPAFFTEALKPARTKRERDMLLLGILVNLSGCMPNVRIIFDQRPLSPQFFLLVIAPSAAGKGILSLTGILPEAIDNYLKGENKRKKAAYERELKEWEQQNQSSRKKHTPTSDSASTSTSASAPVSMPEEPEYHYLIGAPNTSRNQLISRLKTNGDLGLIINATELDTISGSIKQDYGRHDDVFRAAFHHESVATDFKTDQKIICAEEPRLALCLSGTPNQLPAFIQSTRNGLASRITGYTCEANWHYRSAAPIKGQEDYKSLYKRLSRQVLDMFFLFQQSPTEVTLTDQQWEEHTAYFERLLNEVASEQADAPGSIVIRGGVIVARIASILTAIRKSEGAMHMKEYICTDEDFHSAMLIVKTTLNHTLLLTSSLPGEEKKTRPMKSYFRLRPVLNSLDSSFTYKEIKEKALSKGISERSLCRYLSKLVELEYIKKQEDTYVKRKKFTEKRP